MLVAVPGDGDAALLLAAVKNVEVREGRIGTGDVASRKRGKTEVLAGSELPVWNTSYTYQT